MAKELTAMRMTNYTPSHRETSSIGKRKLLTPDEVLRLPREDALVIFRGQKVLKVEKFDFTKHPESKKMRDCNARDYVPNWRVEQKQLSAATIVENPMPLVKATKRKSKETAHPTILPTSAPKPKLIPQSKSPQISTSQPKGTIYSDKHSKAVTTEEQSNANINEPYRTIGIDDLLADL